MDCSTPAGQDLAKGRRELPDHGYLPIDWHRDFSSAYRWDQTSQPWKTLEAVGAGVEIKWPWELSRFQHLPVLALAWRLKRDGEDADGRRYETEFRDQVTDWICNNPLGVGVNWACEMDLAIRVVNWVAAFLLFGREVQRRCPWQQRFWKSVQQHGRFLYSMLKHPGGKQGNHYAAELAGLYMLAGLCPFLRGAGKWRTLAKRGLQEQIGKQVRGDGVHFEESVSYHLLVTEVFLYPLLLADTTDDAFSREYRAVVVKMLGVIDSIRSSRFEMPQIGDNDDGYFFKPVPLEGPETRVRHLLSFRPRLRQQEAFSSVPELLLRLFLADSPLSTSVQQMARRDGIAVFDRAGWGVLRGGPIQVNICVGPNGESGSGHAHEDGLSICIFWDGQPVIVDPGTYCYTAFPEKRNRFRYGPFHNHPQPVRNESEYSARPPFARIALPETRWQTSQRPPRIEAEASREADRAQRTVELDAESRFVEVTDRLESAEPGRVALCFAPGVEVERVRGNYRIVTPTKSVLQLESKELDFVPVQGLFSAGYGKACNTAWLVCESKMPGLNGSWRLSGR